MDLGVDTNIVVSAILKKGITRNLLFHPGITLFSPAYLEEELQKHKKEFLEKSNLDKNNYDKAVLIILNNISIVDKAYYLRYKSESLEISPDPFDWIFFAVAFYKKCALWSNDKKLKNQSKIKVFDTSDLISILRQG